jgi:hypothetical protein
VSARRNAQLAEAGAAAEAEEVQVSGEQCLTATEGLAEERGRGPSVSDLHTPAGD